MVDGKTNKEDDFAALMAESERSDPRLRRAARAAPGDRVSGRVTSIGNEVVFVDLDGGRGEGMLDLVDVRDRQGQLTVAVGDAIEAVVVEAGTQGRAVALRRSVGRGSDARTRADLEEAVAHGLPVEGTITGVNKGGVDVMVAGLRAFCPISQLDARQVQDASTWVGQKLAFRIVRYQDDRRGPDIVVSRRALLEDEARARAVETRKKLQVGAVLPGVVTALKDFGAFVDLGGIEGMLHVSEIGLQRVARPADVLTLGQRIDVQVIRIEKSKSKSAGTSRHGTSDDQRSEQIALSLKSLGPDPWEGMATPLTEGANLRGVVTRVEPFGAFVEVAPGVEGLLHISELGKGGGGGGGGGSGSGGGGGGGRPLRHARDAVKPGAELQVTVLSVDRERRRISLALASGEEPLDQEARTAASRAAAPSALGTFGDLFRGALSKDKPPPGGRR